MVFGGANSSSALPSGRRGDSSESAPLRGLRCCVDVGSGAARPGFGLGLLAPELSRTLVEPKAKRVAFLHAVVGELGCSRVRVQRARKRTGVGAARAR
ncbi:MAG: class I SAM-dependent methyltransferase [Polyangiaceae bacterium]